MTAQELISECTTKEDFAYYIQKSIDLELLNASNRIRKEYKEINPDFNNDDVIAREANAYVVGVLSEKLMQSTIIARSYRKRIEYVISWLEDTKTHISIVDNCKKTLNRDDEDEA